MKGAVIDTLQAAREDYDAVVTLTRDLVRIPSRGGIDPYEPVLACMAARLAEHGLSCRRLAGRGGATVALTCEVPGGRPGPRFVLDACLDPVFAHGISLGEPAGPTDIDVEEVE